MGFLLSLGKLNLILFSVCLYALKRRKTMFILNEGAIFASLGTGNSMQAKQIELESARSKRDSLESQRSQEKSNSSSGSSQTVSGGGQSTEVNTPRSSGPQVGQGAIDEQNALVLRLEGEISDMRGQASTKEGQDRANNQNQVKQNNPSLGV